MDDAYAAEITKQAIARAAVALGFKHINKSAMDSLADVVQHYIQSIALSAKDQAETAGRPYAGIQDLIPCLEFGRPKSTQWKQLRDFAFEDVKNPTADNSTKWCQPFPTDISNFPVDMSGSTGMAEADMKSLNDGSRIRDPFIPSHLPAYPPLHTYKHTRSAAGKKRSIGSLSSSSNNNASNASSDNKEKKRAGSSSAQKSLSLIEDSVDLVRVPVSSTNN